MKTLIFVAFQVFIFHCLISTASSKELTGNEIIARADKIMVGKTAKFHSVMLIRRPDVEDLLVKYTTYFMGRGERALLRITYPPKQVGKDLLLRDENIWQYVPKIERSVRVAGSQSFLGGEFNNSDLVKTSLVKDYSGILEKTEVIDGKVYYFLILSKKRPSATYHKVHYWVEKETFIPFKEIYFTLSGKKMKSLFYKNVGQLDDRVRPRQLVMINALRPKSKTIIDLIQAKYNLKLSKSMFTRVYLEKGRR